MATQEQIQAFYRLSTGLEAIEMKIGTIDKIDKEALKRDVQLVVDLIRSERLKTARIGKILHERDVLSRRHLAILLGIDDIYHVSLEPNEENTFDIVTTVPHSYTFLLGKMSGLLTRTHRKFMVNALAEAFSLTPSEKKPRHKVFVLTQAKLPKKSRQAIEKALEAAAQAEENEEEQ